MPSELFWTFMCVVALPWVINMAFCFAFEPVGEWIIEAVKRRRRAAAARGADKE
jgi:hypothetical protein